MTQAQRNLLESRGMERPDLLNKDALTLLGQIIPRPDQPIDSRSYSHFQLKVMPEVRSAWSDFKQWDKTPDITGVKDRVERFGAMRTYLKKDRVDCLQASVNSFGKHELNVPGGRRESTSTFAGEGSGRAPGKVINSEGRKETLQTKEPPKVKPPTEEEKKTWDKIVDEFCKVWGCD